MKPNVFDGFSLIRDLKDLDMACKAFGFDFPVAKVPLKFEYEGKDVVSPCNEQIVAMDNGDALGVVGLLYTIVPYREAFAAVDELVKGGIRILGGALPNKRERAYLLLESSGSIKLSEGDEIVNRFVMTSSHDGGSKIEIRMTPFRKVNGTALTVDATRPLAFKHTPGVNGRINRARKIFSNVNKSWDEFAANVAKMITVSVTDDEAKAFINNVLGESDSTRMEHIKGDIYATFKTGTACVMPRCKGTVFGLVQAFAEWADHGRTVRQSKRRDEKSAGIDARLISDSAKKKQRAFSTALWFLKTKKLATNAVGAVNA